MPRKAFWRIATAASLLTLALPCLAGGSSLEDKWRAGLREIDQKLRAGQWQAAEEQSRKVARTMVQDSGSGSGAAYGLAVVSAFRAIAERNLGLIDEGNWHWDLALNLFPDIAKTNVSPYGPVAAELKKRSLRTPQEGLPSEQLRLADGATKLANGEVIERPRIVKQVSPEFPRGLARMKAEGALVVETVLGFDGVPRLPVVLRMTGGGAAMEYEALEALRQWRFEPARVKGEPVGVYYTLTVSFQG